MALREPQTTQMVMLWRRAIYLVVMSRKPERFYLLLDFNMHRQ